MKYSPCSQAATERALSKHTEQIKVAPHPLEEEAASPKPLSCEGCGSAVESFPGMQEVPSSILTWGRRERETEDEGGRREEEKKKGRGEEREGEKTEDRGRLGQ